MRIGEVLTMAEYINRERARFEAKRYFKNMDEIQEDLDMLFCMLPAADVAPVRKGRWESVGLSSLKCSDCGYLDDMKMYHRYCPDCGCFMR